MASCKSISPVGPSQSSSYIPQIKADETLRAFRRESNLSWKGFNEVWMCICAFVNAPSNDVLFQQPNDGMYKVKLSEITDDILQTGIFGPKSRGTWKFGKYSPEPDREEFTEFIQRVTEYAVRKVIEHASVPTVDGHVVDQGDKVEMRVGISIAPQGI